MLTVKAPLAATVFSYTIGVGTQIIHISAYIGKDELTTGSKKVFFFP